MLKSLFLITVLISFDFAGALTNVGDSVSFNVRIRNTGTSNIQMVPEWPPVGLCGDFVREYVEVDTVIGYDSPTDTFKVNVHRRCKANGAVLETDELIKATDLFNSQTFALQMTLCDLNNGRKYEEDYKGANHRFCRYKDHDGREVVFGDIPFGIISINHVFTGGYLRVRRIE